MKTGSGSSAFLPFVSVIIPLAASENAPFTCFYALEQQSYPLDRFEVLVICDGGVSPLLDSAFDFPSFNSVLNMRLLSQPQRGSYAARNKGIAEAHGAVIAFTDADCVPHPSWLAQGVACFTAEPEVSAFGGGITFSYQRAGKPNVYELYDSSVFLQQEKLVRRHGFAATANLFVRRDVFGRVGVFDERLRSGGDGEWGTRAAGFGVVTHYKPEVVVQHPARHTLPLLLKKWRRVMGGFAAQPPLSSYRWGGSRGAATRLLFPPLVTFTKEAGHFPQHASLRQRAAVLILRMVLYYYCEGCLAYYRGRRALFAFRWFRFRWSPPTPKKAPASHQDK